MKHIRYMSKNETVCEKPWYLGHDFVMVDRGMANEESCNVCMKLLTAHNRREYEREELITLAQQNQPLETPVRYPSPRIVVALVIMCAFWMILSIVLMSRG